MSIIRCPKCGQMASDHDATCGTCGAMLIPSNPYQGQGKNYQSPMQRPFTEPTWQQSPPQSVPQTMPQMQPRFEPYQQQAPRPDITVESAQSDESGFRCPKCGGHNVSVQLVNEVHLKNAHHGCLWWLVVGWWWVPVKWLFLTVPAFLAAIFIPKKQKAVNKTRKMRVCQNCGYSWKL